MVVPLAQLQIQPVDIGGPLRSLMQANMAGMQMDRQNKLLELQEGRAKQQDELRRLQLALQTRKLEQMDKREAFGVVANAARAVRDPQQWEQMLDLYTGAGYDVAPYRGKYDQRDAILAGLEQKLVPIGEGGLYDANKSEVVAQRPPKARFEKVGDTLLDVTDGTPRPVYTAPEDPAKAREKLDKEGKEKFDREKSLRTEFQKLGSEYRVVEDAYSRMKAAADNATPAGDITLVYSFAKLQDPNSVVREQEFETVAQSGGLGERVKSAVSQITGSGRLSPELRQQLLAEAESLYTVQKRSFERTREQFKGWAEGYGLNPGNVIGSPGEPAPILPTPSPPANAVQAGALGTDLPDLRKKYGLD